MKICRKLDKKITRPAFAKLNNEQDHAMKAILKYQFIFILCLVVLCRPVWSQKFLHHQEYKFVVSKNLFNELVNAFGSSLAPPQLEINRKIDNQQKFIASYIPGSTPMIIFDEEVYDVCVTYGTDSLNALASIMSHELAHYFQRHNFCSDFASTLGSQNSLVKDISSIEKSTKVKTESEADYYGMFYGYVAGFETYRIVPSLLENIYGHYHLPEQVTGYPSLTERKGIASLSAKKLEEWCAIFDAGELLFVLKRYDEAFRCFDKLAREFPSREIINNAGVIKVYSALELTNSEEFPFILPIEFDAVTRLKQGNSRSLPDSDANRKNDLLNTAKDLFEKASEKDPAYLNSRINLGCTYLLLKNYEMVIGLMNPLIQQPANNLSSENLARVFALQGMAKYYLQDKKSAEENFIKAYELSKVTSLKYNLHVFEELNKGVLQSLSDNLSYLIGLKKDALAKPEISMNPINEKIDQKSIDQLTLTITGKSIAIDESPLPIDVHYQYSTDHSEIFIQTPSSVLLKSLNTDFKYSGRTSQGIGLNYPMSTIVNRYGSPTYIIDSYKGKYLVYRKARIIFYINPAGLVAKWSIYKFD